MSDGGRTKPGATASHQHSKEQRASLLMSLSLVGLLLVAAVLAIWLQHHRPQSQAGPIPVAHLTTGYIGEYAALILIAQHQGYFKANGLDVNLKPYDSGPAALSDLLAGKLDTAMASDFAGVRNSFSGQDLKILANVAKSETFYMIARRDRGIHNVPDLKGKTIGVTRQTVGEFYLGQFLTYNHLSLSDVRLVNLPQQELVANLQEGGLDAAVLFEPNAYQAVAKLGAPAQRWPIQSGQKIYSLLYATSRLTAQPDVIRRYLRAVVQAEDFVRSHDAQSRTIVAQRLGYDTAYINYIWPKFTYAVSLDQELLLNMDDEARWAIENHLTPSPTVPNYLHLLYTSGLDAIKPAGITIIR